MVMLCFANRSITHVTPNLLRIRSDQLANILTAIAPTIPASILREHPDATLVIDDAAASKLDAELKSKLESGV